MVPQLISPSAAHATHPELAAARVLLGHSAHTLKLLTHANEHMTSHTSSPDDASGKQECALGQISARMKEARVLRSSAQCKTKSASIT